LHKRASDFVYTHIAYLVRLAAIPQSDIKYAELWSRMLLLVRTKNLLWKLKKNSYWGQLRT